MFEGNIRQRAPSLSHFPPPFPLWRALSVGLSRASDNRDSNVVFKTRHGDELVHVRLLPFLSNHFSHHRRHCFQTVDYPNSCASCLTDTSVEERLSSRSDVDDLRTSFSIDPQAA